LVGLYILILVKMTAVLLLKAAANTLDAMQKSADQRDEKEV